MTKSYHVWGDFLYDLAREMADLITDDVIHTNGVWVVLQQVRH